MAKKVTPKSAVPAVPAVPAAAAPTPASPPSPAGAAMKATKPRETAAPATPAVMPDPPAVTDQMIADRAYFKWQNGEAGDHHHHWVSSARELRGDD